MKNALRALFALTIALWCAPAQAQLAQNIRFVTSTPAGACKKGEQFRYKLTTNDLYGCYDSDNDGNGTWTLMGSATLGALLSSNNLSDLADATTARTNIGLKKFSCTGTPVLCLFYDDTATTGRSIFRIRMGAGQDWRPFEIWNNSGTVVSGVEPDGSINQYTSGARSASFYQNRVSLGIGGKHCWFSNADLDAGSADTCLVRNSAGVAEVQDNSGSTRDLKVRNIEVTGTCTGCPSGSGSPAGSNTYVQYNSSGSFGAEAAFAYDASTNTLSVDKISLTGTASESILTDISTPSAPASGKTAVYTKSGRWCSRANGGSEVCYADGNSSGEATKGVAGAYDPTSWNGSSETPTKDAIRDKIESMSSGSGTVTSILQNFEMDGGILSLSTADGVTAGGCYSSYPVCFLSFDNTADTISRRAFVPAQWTSGTVTALVSFQGDASGNTVQYKVQVGCLADNVSSTVSFNSYTNLASTATSGENSYTKTATVDMTGCAANRVIVVRVGMNSISSGTSRLTGLALSYAIP